METIELCILCVATFLVSILGVVTGGHSMLTVPLMIFFGMAPAAAVATNRFANMFLAGSGISEYYRNRKIPLRFVWPFVVAAIPGGALGAFLVTRLSGDLIRTVIGVCMLVIVFVSFFFRNKGLADLTTFEFPRWRFWLGVVVAFFIGAYWGFFGGGGMTLFTVFLTVTFGFSLLQSVGSSNIAMGASSLLASVVFFFDGAIDLWIGLAMGVAMAGGAWIGAHLSIKIGNVWVKRIFTLMILFMAIKMITGWPDLRLVLTR